MKLQPQLLTRRAQPEQILQIIQQGVQIECHGRRDRRTRWHIVSAVSDDGLLLELEPGVRIAQDEDLESFAVCEIRGRHPWLPLAHFIDCIETGAKPLTDSVGSLEWLQIIWKLYEAEEANAVADLKGLGLGTWQKP